MSQSQICAIISNIDELTDMVNDVSDSELRKKMCRKITELSRNFGEMCRPVISEDKPKPEKVPEKVPEKIVSYSFELNDDSDDNIVHESDTKSESEEDSGSELKDEPEKKNPAVSKPNKPTKELSGTTSCPLDDVQKKHCAEVMSFLQHIGGPKDTKYLDHKLDNSIATKALHTFYQRCRSVDNCSDPILGAKHFRAALMRCIPNLTIYKSKGVERYVGITVGIDHFDGDLEKKRPYWEGGWHYDWEYTADTEEKKSNKEREKRVEEFNKRMEKEMQADTEALAAKKAEKKD